MLNIKNTADTVWNLNLSHFRRPGLIVSNACFWKVLPVDVPHVSQRRNTNDENVSCTRIKVCLYSVDLKIMYNVANSIIFKYEQIHDN